MSRRATRTHANLHYRDGRLPREQTDADARGLWCLDMRESKMDAEVTQ